MLVQMPQQTIALAGRDLGQAFPAFAGQHPLVHPFATLGPVSAIEEGGGVLLKAATDQQLHITHPVNHHCLRRHRRRPSLRETHTSSCQLSRAKEKASSSHAHSN